MCWRGFCAFSSSSCWACFGVMVTCGGERGAAALQASARFVPSCVQVNTFCSRPSVQAQICMRVGRLGWKRRRGRQLERGQRRGKKEGIKGDERQRVGAENSVIFILGLHRTFYNQMPLFLPKGIFILSTIMNDSKQSSNCANWHLNREKYQNVSV